MRVCGAGGDRRAGSTVPRPACGDVCHNKQYQYSYYTVSNTEHTHSTNGGVLAFSLNIPYCVAFTKGFPLHTVPLYTFVRGHTR